MTEAQLYAAATARWLRGMQLGAVLHGMSARNELSCFHDEEPWYDETDFGKVSEQFLRLAEQVEAME